MRGWRKNNPGRQASLSADYDARKRSAFVEEIDRQTVWLRDEGICGICDRPAEQQNFHIDHIKPISKGGLHRYANVQVAHPACNHEKHAKELI
jgi:5-methylcytosine-specific restriction endonuclease McrA